MPEGVVGVEGDQVKHGAIILDGAGFGNPGKDPSHREHAEKEEKGGRRRKDDGRWRRANATPSRYATRRYATLRQPTRDQPPRQTLTRR